MSKHSIHDLKPANKSADDCAPADQSAQDFFSEQAKPADSEATDPGIKTDDTE